MSRLTESDLLAWATVNAQSEDNTVNRPLQPLDPKWVDVILGKGDAIRLKECFEVVYSDKSLEEKLQAFDEIELLVESIDNANDLRPLGLWPKLLKALEFEEDELRMFSLWVIGTAIQNNEKAQQAFYDFEALGHILRALEQDKSIKVRQKALYCLSSAIRQNKQLYDQFVKQDGYQLLFQLFGDADTSIVTRSLFLLNQLLKDETIQQECLSRLGNVPNMILDLIPSINDIALLEEAFAFMVQIKSSGLLPSNAKHILHQKLSDLIEGKEELLHLYALL
ncbi:armadillo-type protein [Gorgonomyces haynaldii]|nr:armadillo-type protein [Gorgonomyces haynaldii]